MDKQTREVVEAALRLPDFERSALLHRMWARPIRVVAVGHSRRRPEYWRDRESNQ